MIRGPMLPQTRQCLRQLLLEHPELLERGLRVVLEDFDCQPGGAAPVEILARDADGCAVFVFVTDAEDVGLLPRLIGAHAFAARNAAALPRALPEAELRFAPTFRCVVVGREVSTPVREALLRLQLPGLEVYEVETFRVGGQERVLLRALDGRLGPTEPQAQSFAAGPRRVWEGLSDLLQRLDPDLRLDGDRFSRRAVYHGRLLCEFWYAEGHVFASLPGGSAMELQGVDDVRSIGDQVLRRFLGIVAEPQSPVGGVGARADRVEVKEGATRLVAPGLPLESLRATLTASRLTREEFSALGGPEAEEEVPERR